MPKKELDETFENFIKRLELKPEIFDSIEATLLNKHHERKNEIIQSSIDVYQTIAALKTEQKAKAERLGNCADQNNRKNQNGCQGK